MIRVNVIFTILSGRLVQMCDMPCHLRVKARSIACITLAERHAQIARSSQPRVQLAPRDAAQASLRFVRAGGGRILGHKGGLGLEHPMTIGQQASRSGKTGLNHSYMVLLRKAGQGLAGGATFCMGA